MIDIFSTFGRLLGSAVSFYFGDDVDPGFFKETGVHQHMIPLGFCAVFGDGSEHIACSISGHGLDHIGFIFGTSVDIQGKTAAAGLNGHRPVVVSNGVTENRFADLSKV